MTFLWRFHPRRSYDARSFDEPRTLIAPSVIFTLKKQVTSLYRVEHRLCCYSRISFGTNLQVLFFSTSSSIVLGRPASTRVVREVASTNGTEFFRQCVQLTIHIPPQRHSTLIITMARQSTLCHPISDKI